MKASEASRLERGRFTLPNLPLWLASLTDFFAVSLRFFFNFPPPAEPRPGGASIVQVSSLFDDHCKSTLTQAGYTISLLSVLGVFLDRKPL